MAFQIQQAFLPRAQAQAEFLTDDLLSRMATREDLKQSQTRLQMQMQLLGRALTIRLGGMVALGVVVLAALIRF